MTTADGHLHIPEDDPDAAQLGLGAAALRYASLGLAALRLRPGSKKPVTGSHGLLDATTDPAVIRGWWAENRALNVGIGTGQRSGGLFVIDLDAKNGHDGIAVFRGWLAERGLVLPDVPYAVTPSGGRHLFLRSASRAVQNRNGVLPGVDISGDGGYVAAWPSGIEAPALRRSDDHPGRKPETVLLTYSWHGCPCQAPLASPELLDALDELQGSGNGSGSGGNGGGDGHGLLPAETLMETGLTPGSRNYDMYRLACRLWRQHGQGGRAEVEAVCRRIWQATAQGPDPFPWTEARGRIESARQWTAREDAAEAAWIREMHARWGRPAWLDPASLPSPAAVRMSRRIAMQEVLHG